MKVLNPKIIYQDQDLLVIEKPAGLVVNRAETVKEKTLQDWLERKIEIKKDNKNKEFANRSGIVHRLDKETSGVMVVAKTPEAFVDLQRQFKERKVIKKYLSLVHGRLIPKKGDIKAPIKRNPIRRKRFGVFVDGRASESGYQVLDYYQDKNGKDYSYLEVEPKTGRTHQIRVHLAHIHHPVVADELYAGSKTAKKDRQWCPRLFLHAAYLEFKYPENGKRMRFEANLAKDLEKALDFNC